MTPPPIAIVGIAADLPSGYHDTKNLDHRDFYDFLFKKQQSYQRIPTDRFNIDALQGPALGQVLPQNGSFLKDLDAFDYLEFGVTPKDAETMAVSTRKLIHLSFTSLLDAGIDYRGRNVGCYMAGVSHDTFMVSGQDEYRARGSFAGGPSMIANRVSYALDIRGPSVPIDTACSSSLTAMHLAVQALRAGECEAAVVGGCQINIRVADWLNYTQGGVVADTCKPFSAEADGFSRGEGGVVIVLKLLSDALRDGDRIYGSILGTAINSNGSLAPVSAPVAHAQEAAMREVFRQCRRSPQEVDFLELHATGTARGDPTEANWVGYYFQRDGEILLGSVKGNIGHLEITAFLASLSKVLSIFERGIIPPNVNLKTLNPAIAWEPYQLRVPIEPTPLPLRNGRALVAMTSSGIGGANGSCVIESPPASACKFSVDFWATNAASRPHLFVCGGLSPRTSSAVADSLLGQLKDGVQAESLVLSHGRRARSMPWITYAVTPDNDDVRFSEPILAPKGRGPLVFVFSGQGPQHLAMGKELFRASNVFSQTVRDLDCIYERMAGHSLIRKYGLFDDEIDPESSLDDIWPIAVTLPALTIVQIALLDTLAFLGLKPDIVVGHSAGETATLYASGAATKELTLELSIARGRGMSSLESAGCSMAAINCTPADAERIIAQVAQEPGAGPLEIGCYNGEEALTLSGADAQLKQAVNIATERGIFARKLKTRVAVHSSMMENCREAYRTAVNDVFSRHTLSKPKVTIYSSSTGKVMLEAGGADYFWTNTRGPVFFTEAIQALVHAHSNASFLEIGPHPVLASYLSALAGSDAIIECPLRRLNPTKPKNVEVRALLTTIGRLTTTHHHVDYSLLAGPQATILHSMPAYPFQPKSIPFQLPTHEVQRFLRPRNGPLNFEELCINTATHPSLADHVINSMPIMPATGYLEMALEFGARKIWDVSFLSMLGLTSARPTPVRIYLEDSQWTVKSASAHSGLAYDHTTLDRVHAEGFLSHEISEEEKIPKQLDLSAARTRCITMDPGQFYADIEHFANYGPEYRRITSISFGPDGEAVVELRGSTVQTAKDPPYILHPAIMDAAVHAGIHPAMTGNRDPAYYYLPASLRAATIHDAALEIGMPETIATHIVRRKWTPKFIEFDCSIMTLGGIRLCTFEGLGIERHGGSTNLPSIRYDIVYMPTEQTMDPSPTPSPSNAAMGDEGSPPRAVLASISDQAFSHVYVYTPGQELLLQPELVKLENWKHHTIWFIASADQGGALGFTRSLRREYTAWTIKLVSFISQCPEEQKRALSQLMLTLELEDEVVIDFQGRILVPRLISTNSPPVSHIYDSSQPWRVLDGHVQLVDLPNIHGPSGHRTLVELIRVSADPMNNLREFIGLDTSSPQLFMGITTGPLSNYASVALDVCIPVPSEDRHRQKIPPLVAVAILAAGVGIGALTAPSRLSGSTVVVTHADATVGRSLVQLLGVVGIASQAIPSNASSADLCRLIPADSFVVLSGYGDRSVNRMLQARMESKSRRVFAWNDSKDGLAAILDREPWTLGDAIRHVFDAGLFAKVHHSSILPPLTLVENPPLPGHQISSSRRLFDSTKAYLIIGGIGSIGLDVSYWMYENGAKHVILTSRSGRRSLAARGDDKSERMLAFLEQLPDLNLRLVAVDAADVGEMKMMVAGVVQPIGGVMLLSAVLNDKLFTRQDGSSFHSAFPSKVGAMRALQQVLDISCLDWLIAFTSVSGFFGNAGQTNYASANTALDVMLRDIPNAFSLVIPVVLDSTIAAGPDVSRIRHLATWGITSRELCACIKDGIQKLNDGPLWLYFPNVDWKLVARHTGIAPCFRHLVPEDTASDAASPSLGRTIEDVVLHHVDVDRADLSLDVPLTSYGLDSLSAARLALDLRSFAPLTSMQLLGDMSIGDIYHHAQTFDAMPQDGSTKVDAVFDWKNFHQNGQSVVKVLDSKDPSDVPLIFMHGASGTGMFFSPLQGYFTTPFWFLQTTPDMPVDSMDALVAFYMHRIQEARPHGPYRFAAYCATTVVAVELVRAIEAIGERVVQLVFIDHVPTVYCRPSFAPSLATLQSGRMSDAALRSAFTVLLDLFDSQQPAQAQLRAELEAAWDVGGDLRARAKDYVHYFRCLVRIIMGYLLELAPHAHGDVDTFVEEMHNALCARVRDIRAPIRVWVASEGLIVAAGETSEHWSHMGIKPGAVMHCPGGHSEVFELEEFAKHVEFDWSLESTP